MVDFWSAATTGLQAYEDFNETAKTVHEVVEELNRQMVEGTKGRIQVQWHSQSRTLGEMILRKLESTTPKPGNMLVVVSGNRQEGLAQLTLSERGWPVDLVYADDNASCYDKDALEQALQKMLMHPRIGKVLGRLLASAPSEGGAATPAIEP